MIKSDYYYYYKLPYGETKFLATGINPKDVKAETKDGTLFVYNRDDLIRRLYLPEDYEDVSIRFEFGVAFVNVRRPASKKPKKVEISY